MYSSAITRPGKPTTPKAAFQPHCAAMTPPSITPSTEPMDADAKKPAIKAPRMRAGKWLASRPAPTEP